MLGTKGDDGVFRYEPPKDDPADANKPRPGDIDDDVADWFEGTSAAEVAAAVREVEREAAVTIEEQDAARTAAYRNPELPPSRPAVGPADADRQSGDRPSSPDSYPTQGYPGRDTPAGPPPGYRQPGGPGRSEGPPPGYQQAPPPGYSQQPPQQGQQPPPGQPYGPGQR
jgi:hypothetical protein